MSNEVAAVARWVALIVALVGATIVSASYYACYAPTKNGMCQGSTPGVQGWVWVKCDPTAK